MGSQGPQTDSSPNRINLFSITNSTFVSTTFSPVSFGLFPLFPASQGLYWCRFNYFAASRRCHRFRFIEGEIRSPGLSVAPCGAWFLVGIVFLSQGLPRRPGLPSGARWRRTYSGCGTNNETVLNADFKSPVRNTIASGSYSH